MLTPQNYNTEKVNIIWANVPTKVAALKNDVEDIIEFYNDDAEIKAVVDTFIKKVNASQKKEAPKPAPKKEIKKVAKKVVDAKIVDNFSKEFMLIRRFYNFVSRNETAPFRKIQLLYMAFEKAIVGRDVRKANNDADLFSRVNKKMVALYKIVEPKQQNADIDFTDKALLKEMETFVKGRKVNYAITLLKSFIGMQGYKPETKKATNLLKRIENAIKNGRVDSKNRLYKSIKDAKTELQSYLKKPTVKIDTTIYGLSIPAQSSCKNRIKCTGLSSKGRLRKGYKFAKGGKVVKALGNPRTCVNRRKCEGLKANGTLKKGYKFAKGGAVIKVNSKKKPKKALGTVLIHTAPSTPTPAIVEGYAMAQELEVIEPIEVVAKTPTPKPIIEPEPVQKPTPIIDKHFGKLKELGFVLASDSPKEAKGVFTLPNAIGSFIQKIQPHKALILIKGNKHSSKSQLAMQIADAFGQLKMPVAYIDYEQGGMESKDTIDSLNRNTTAQGREFIAIKGFLDNPLQELKQYCEYCNVIIADSVTDLHITADQLNELRVSYPKVIWIFISQVKENGQMYGGNKMAHNPTCIINCHTATNAEKRYATLEKNRGNDISLAYSIYNKTLIDIDEFTSVAPKFPSEVTIS